MTDNFGAFGRTSLYKLIGLFSLLFLVVLLTTLAAGLIWCQPPTVQMTVTSSPVGTWVSADAWERGSAAGDTVIEFTEGGLMTIAPGEFSALYRYEDNAVFLLGMDEDTAGISSDDHTIPANTQQYKCIIAGDHMSFYGQIPGIRIHHGRTDLIRISSQTGLSPEDIASLY